MDIVESINRYLAGAPTSKGERTRLTRARDEIVRLRTTTPAPAQEPVAWVLVDGELSYPDEIDWETLQEQGHEVVLLYTSSLAKPWVGLTDEEIADIEITWEATQEWACFRYAARAIEAKLKEKNT